VACYKSLGRGAVAVACYKSLGRGAVAALRASPCLLLMSESLP
jgi:hypothetical protein